MSKNSASLNNNGPQFGEENSIVYPGELAKILSIFPLKHPYRCYCIIHKNKNVYKNNTVMSSTYTVQLNVMYFPYKQESFLGRLYVLYEVYILKDKIVNKEKT